MQKKVNFFKICSNFSLKRPFLGLRQAENLILKPNQHTNSHTNIQPQADHRDEEMRVKNAKNVEKLIFGHF